MGKLKLVLESTRSRRGGHIARKAALVIRSDGSIAAVSPSGGQPVKGTYAKGFAREVEVELAEGDTLVWVHLVRNNRGHVKGEFIVYDHRGTLLLRAVYRKMKLRRSWGDPSYSWAIERAIEAFKMDRFVKRINMSTGASE